eukprot:3342915-Prymnesium_polylepis.4
MRTGRLPALDVNEPALQSGWSFREPIVSVLEPAQLFIEEMSPRSTIGTPPSEDGLMAAPVPTAQVCVKCTLAPSTTAVES